MDLAVFLEVLKFTCSIQDYKLRALSIYQLG